MTFTIHQPLFDDDKCIAKFPFSLGAHEFVETLIFPKDFGTTLPPSEVFQNLLNLSACVLGTSYFKLLAPVEIIIPDFALSPQQQRLVLDVYENGLGEFYARNQLSRFGKLKLMVDAEHSSLPSARPSKNSNPRSLLLIGGGKDSNVSAQLLQNQNIEFTPFAVNPKGPIHSSIAVMNKSPLFVQRHLDPKMIALSKQPPFLNGHVPSTAINSMIAALTATMFGYDTIILSNERSASQANTSFDGRRVNHQHSKSLAFEQLLRTTLIETSDANLDYFSLLRPLSELRIAKIFSQSEIFDAHFSSCNTNFRQGENQNIHWCNTCPKCHFVYLMLAPFMDQKRLTKIFGDNPFKHQNNIASFQALTGLKDQKPWECVGEIMEAAAALYHVFKATPNQQDDIPARLGPALEKFHGEKNLIAAWDNLFINSNDHCLPYHFTPCINTF